MIRKTRLYTPGPTPLLPAAQFAMAAADIHHRTPEFRALYTRVLSQLKDFVGTTSDGIVAIYNGLPYDFIVPFWERTYTSGLPASEVPVADRKTLFDHDLRSQNQAIAIVRAAERGSYPKPSSSK